MRGLSMAFLAMTATGEMPGHNCARIRFTKTMAKKTTVTTV
jgi:hypothetical protein